MVEDIKLKKIGKPKEADICKLSKKERKQRLNKNISWDQYYSTGRGRLLPVGEAKYNPCQYCANNMYHKYGDEDYCHSCKEYNHFQKLTGYLEFKIKLFDFLNRRGIRARQKKNWPYFKID